MRCSNMAAEFKKGEKPGRYPSHYTDSFTAKNTCTDNYGALYCKVCTLRLDLRKAEKVAHVVSSPVSDGSVRPSQLTLQREQLLLNDITDPLLNVPPLARAIRTLELATGKTSRGKRNTPFNFSLKK